MESNLLDFQIEELGEGERYAVRGLEGGFLVLDTERDAVIVSDLPITSATWIASVLNRGNFSAELLEFFAQQIDLMEEQVSGMCDAIPTPKLGNMHTVSISVGRIRKLREGLDGLVTAYGRLVSE